MQPVICNLNGTNILHYIQSGDSQTAAMSFSYDDLSHIGATELSAPYLCITCFRPFRTLIPKRGVGSGGSNVLNTAAPSAGSHVLCPSCGTAGRPLSESQMSDFSRLSAQETAHDEAETAAPPHTSSGSAADHPSSGAIGDGDGGLEPGRMLLQMREWMPLLSSIFGEGNAFTALENITHINSDTPTDEVALKGLKRVIYAPLDGKSHEGLPVLTELPSVTTLSFQPDDSVPPDTNTIANSNTGSTGINPADYASVSGGEAPSVVPAWSGLAEMVAVPAAFSGVLPGPSVSPLKLRLRLTLPYTGDAAGPYTGLGWPDALPHNHSELKGCAVVMDRGDIPFAAKGQCAERCGAAALVVVQNSENAKQWPLQMVDNTKLLKGPLSIPVVMISHLDGVRLKKAVGTHSVCCTLQSKAKADCCPVCMDAFQPGDVLTFVSCQHMFHDACIVPWLKKRNTCPLCRTALPAADGTPANARQRETELHRERERMAMEWYG